MDNEYFPVPLYLFSGMLIFKSPGNDILLQMNTRTQAVKRQQSKCSMTFASLGVSETIVRAVGERDYTDSTSKQIQTRSAISSGRFITAARLRLIVRGKSSLKEPSPNDSVNCRTQTDPLREQPRTDADQGSPSNPAAYPENTDTLMMSVFRPQQGCSCLPIRQDRKTVTPNLLA